MPELHNPQCVDTYVLRAFFLGGHNLIHNALRSRTLLVSLLVSCFFFILYLAEGNARKVMCTPPTRPPYFLFLLFSPPLQYTIKIASAGANGTRTGMSHSRSLLRGFRQSAHGGGGEGVGGARRSSRRRRGGRGGQRDIPARASVGAPVSVIMVRWWLAYRARAEAEAGGGCPSGRCSAHFCTALW